MINGARMNKLTANIGALWHMAVQQWAVWAASGHITQILAQILLTHWLVEEIRQDANSVTVEFLAMLSKFADIRNVGSSNLDDAHQLIFTANLAPFLGDALAFLHIHCGSFACVAVNHNAADAFLLQQLSVLVDDVAFDSALPETQTIVVDGTSAKAKIELTCLR